MFDLVKIKFADEEMTIDPKELSFNENNIGEAMERIGNLTSYYGQSFAKAEYWLELLEKRYDDKYMAAFAKFKNDGAGSDKLCDAMVKSLPEIIELGDEIVNAKFAKVQLQQYLKAVDRTHSSLISRSYTLRKEMDKFPTSNLTSILNEFEKEGHENE